MKIRLNLRCLEYIDGERLVSLSRGEAMLLAILIKAQGQPVSRYIINDQMRSNAQSRSPDTMVAQIRKRLGRNLISTKHGVGWAASTELINSLILESEQQPEYMI